MTTKDTLSLALEALEKLWLLGDKAGAIAGPAITAIKQAQQAQEPRFWYDEDMGELYSFHDNKPVDGLTPLYAAPKAMAPLTDEQQRTNRHQISAMQSAYNVLTNGPMVRGCKYSREFAILELKGCLDAAHGIHAKGGQHEDA